MKNKLEQDKHFSHADHVSWRRVENEVVVLDLNTSVYFSLNEAGALVWEKIGAGASLGEVQAAVCKEYSVEPDRAQQDIAKLVDQMLKENILIAAK